jgi:hypothetical protein
MNKLPSGVALTFLGSKMTYATSESTGRDCPKVSRIGAGSSVPVVADHWRRTFAAVIAVVGPASAQDAMKVIRVTPDALAWKDNPNIPPGAQVAVI